MVTTRFLSKINLEVSRGTNNFAHKQGLSLISYLRNVSSEYARMQLNEVKIRML